MGIKAFVALGGNLGDVLACFSSCRKMLGEIKGLAPLDASPAYRSPLGPPGQPDYYNAAMMLEADIDAQMLLQQLLSVENRHGRIRSANRWGARTLDLDLIAYDDTVMQTTQLTLPHPHMHERMFVLQPLCDIRPNWRHPVLKQTARELMESLAAHGTPLLKQRESW